MNYPKARNLIVSREADPHFEISVTTEHSNRILIVRFQISIIYSNCRNWWKKFRN